MERVIIFIDGCNFYYGFKRNNIDQSIDFDKFAKLLCQGRTYIRTNYYIVSFPKENDSLIHKNQQEFIERVKKTPDFSISYGKLAKREAKLNQEKLMKDFGEELATKILERFTKMVTFVEKRVDVNLAVDMVTMAYDNAYDTAILISSDSDFAKAIEVVKGRGKNVENAYFENGKSEHLSQLADKFIPITKDIIAKCAIAKKEDSWLF